MQCFICVTYMIILCSGNPTKTRDLDNKYEKFSFVNNFITSLFHTQPTDEVNDNEENKLTHNFYKYDNYQNLLNEADFMPRRNDRIAMPPLQYRLPKSMRNIATEDRVLDKPKEEIIIYINSNKSQKTENLKKERPRPLNKNKIETDDESQNSQNLTPFSNSMAGQSQIGDRESQTVVKPTVIVNIRGSVTNRDSDIRLDKKVDEANETDITRNVFNIKQDVNLNSDIEPKKKGNEVKTVVKSVKRNKSDEDMIMCESNSWKQKKNEERKLDNVMEILLTV